MLAGARIEDNSGTTQRTVAVRLAKQINTKKQYMIYYNPTTGVAPNGSRLGKYGYFRLLSYPFLGTPNHLSALRITESGLQ